MLIPLTFDPWWGNWFPRSPTIPVSWNHQRWKERPLSLLHRHHLTLDLRREDFCHYNFIFLETIFSYFQSWFFFFRPPILPLVVLSLFRPVFLPLSLSSPSRQHNSQSLRPNLLAEGISTSHQESRETSEGQVKKNNRKSSLETNGCHITSQVKEQSWGNKLSNLSLFLPDFWWKSSQVFKREGEKKNWNETNTNYCCQEEEVTLNFSLKNTRKKGQIRCNDEREDRDTKKKKTTCFFPSVLLTNTDWSLTEVIHHLNEYTVNIEVFNSLGRNTIGETCYYYEETDFLWLILSVGHSLYIHIYFTSFSFHSFFTVLWNEQFKILYKEKEVRIVSESIIESNDFASKTTFDTSLYNWYNFLTLHHVNHWFTQTFNFLTSSSWIIVITNVILILSHRHQDNDHNMQWLLHFVTLFHFQPFWCSHYYILTHNWIRVYFSSCLQGPFFVMQTVLGVLSLATKAFLVNWLL